MKIDEMRWGEVKLGDGMGNIVYVGGDVIIAGTMFHPWDWKGENP